MSEYQKQPFHIWKEPNPEPTAEEYEKIKAELLRPFDDQEIEEGWSKVKGRKQDALPPRTELLHRSMDGFDFAIGLNAVADLRQIEFQITGRNKEKLANVIFMQDTEYGASDEWDLSHRLVRTGDLGISGSEFLQQCEEYMKALAEKSYIKFENITADCSQEEVIAWLQKNGFDFATEKNREWFEDYQNNPDDYIKVNLSDGQVRSGQPQYNREEFLFKKSEMDADEMTKRLDPNEPDGKHYIVQHSELLKMPGLLRIRLLKKA